MSQLLDRSRPFAEVHGVSDVRYEQDNLCFDYQGRLMVTGEPEAQKAQEAPRKRGRPRKQVEGTE
jgi:hypothetical protein